MEYFLAITAILGVAFSFFIAHKAIKELFPNSVRHLSTIISRNIIWSLLSALLTIGIISFSYGIGLIQELRGNSDAGIGFIIQVMSGAALVTVVPMVLALIFWFLILALQESNKFIR